MAFSRGMALEGWREGASTWGWGRRRWASSEECRADVAGVSGVERLWVRSMLLRGRGAGGWGWSGSATAAGSSSVEEAIDGGLGGERRTSAAAVRGILSSLEAVLEWRLGIGRVLYLDDDLSNACGHWSEDEDEPESSSSSSSSSVSMSKSDNRSRNVEFVVFSGISGTPDNISVRFAAATSRSSADAGRPRIVLSRCSRAAVLASLASVSSACSRVRRIWRPNSVRS